MNCSKLDQGQWTQALRKFTGAAPFGAFLLLLVSTGCGQNSTRATAWLHVGDPQEISGNPSKRNPVEYEQFRNTQVALIKCPVVLRGALDMPGIAELPLIKQQHDPQKWLEGRLRVTCPKDQELIQIDLPGEDGQQAAKIVNAVVQSYIDNIVNADHISKLRNRELVENAYKETMDQMQKKRALMDNLLKQVKGTRTDREFVKQRAANLSKLMTDIRARRLEVDLQAASAEALLAMADDLTPEEKSKAKTDLAVAQAQRKVLERINDDLKHEAEETTEAANDQTQTLSLLEEIKQLEANAAQRAQELDRLKLELSLPQRVIRLQDASAY